MRTRRDFLALGVAAAAASLAPRRLLRATARARRILLLGGTGFIGPHLVHEALARGHQVAMLNRGRREPNQNAGDFAKVEALRGDRSTPEAYAALKGRTWDAVIDTATNLQWTREAVAALKGSTGRYMYVSSTGVFWPYRKLERYGAAGLGEYGAAGLPGGPVSGAAGVHVRRDAYGAAGLDVRRDAHGAAGLPGGPVPGAAGVHVRRDAYGAAGL